MTTPALTEPSGLPPGQIRFVDDWVPALGAGDYTASVTQAVTDGGALVNATFSASVDFTVAGPRFTLAADDVHVALPSPTSSGNYKRILPYIVLTRRSLPWERSVGKAKKGNAPWVALLVLEQDEIVVPTGAQATATGAVARTWGDAVGPRGGDVSGADITLSAADAANRCLTVDVKESLFRRIAPALDELPYFAHVRQVDTGGKEILGIDDDGWFSIVMAKRLPAPGKRNCVHLVSMEGQTKPFGTGVRRLVSLASWWFDCKEEAATFTDRVKKLDSALLALPHDTPKSWTGERTAAQAIAQDALRDGFVPVDYTTRLGEQTTCWYRGPFTPYPVADRSLDGFFSAEAGMIYDERTGMFDMSLAVAWQIGRLLALSDKGFAAAALAWRRTGERGINLLHERVSLRDRFAALLPPSLAAPSLNEAGFAHGVMKRFLGAVLAGKVLSDDKKRTVAPRTDPSGTLAHLARLQGVRPDAVAAALDRGDDPVDALRQSLAAR